MDFTFDFTIEEMSMNAWPALQTCVYDGWIIRLANGYGNRANSINPIYKSKIKLEDKLTYCDDFFARHGLPAAYKLINCEEHKSVEETLAKLNYQKINETSLQICEIPATLQNDFEGIIITDDFDEHWINSVIDYNRIEENHISTFRRILDNIADEKIVVCKKTGNEIAGCGYGAIERNYVGVFDIVVKEEFRRKGYGREIVLTILAEAAKRSIKNSYLQVMLNNPAALHLYEKLGYREIYRYWYRKKTALGGKL